MILRIIFSCLAMLGWHSVAGAWGVQGHQVVAAVAQAQLVPAAQREVARLLALEPGATLESIASWADQQRSPETAAWHYVNFPRGTCAYVAHRDCPDGQCVVGAIEQQAAVLGSAQPDAERLTALKYLVHLVADVHQPLHAGHADDRGGNRYQVQVQVPALGQGSNLHAVWDAVLLQAMGEDTSVLAARWGEQHPPAEAALSSPSSPFQAVGAAQIATASCEIMAKPGFYPLSRQVDQAYLRQFQPVLESQLALAGARLADLLNRLIGAAPQR